MGHKNLFLAPESSFDMPTNVNIGFGPFEHLGKKFK